MYLNHKINVFLCGFAPLRLGAKHNKHNLYRNSAIPTLYKTQIADIHHYHQR